MTFKELSEYFEKLEETSSRLSLIDILSELFSEVKTDEVAMVSYLIQGRVAPFYEPTEIGMAEKSVAKSMARVYGKDVDEVAKMYGKMGDLGKVAFELAGIKKSGNLDIKEVFDDLLKIAKFSGDGTVENKISALAALLEKSSAIEAKHLVRIPLGTSRLGIGDPTVLDAFAKAKLGDKSKRKLLEGAYNRVSDLGMVGEVLWKGGLKAVEDLQVTVGKPIRSQLAERLPNPEAILKKFDGSAHIQKKFDGFRVQIHKDGNNVRLFSRNLEETTHMFPDLIEGVIKQVDAKTAILDSEALAYNPQSNEFLPFQQTTQRRRKHGIEDAAKRLPLKAMVFDMMFLNGKSLMDLPVSERIKYLPKVIKEEEVLTSSTKAKRQGSGEASKNNSERNFEQVLIAQPGKITDNAEVIQKEFDEAISEGLEGLIVKRPDSLYEAGARNFNWVKQKRHSAGELKDTVDCVILGYIFGRGKRAEFGAGALLVGVYDKEKDEFVTVSKIGTGLTDEEWREIHRRADKIKVTHKPARINSVLEPSVWITPEIVIEVLADEITRSPIHTAGRDKEGVGYALRFPRLVRFREADKQAEDATTVKELVEMFKSQYKK